MAECALRGIAGKECSLLQKVYDDFRSANVWYLLLVVVLYLISNVSRALRWNMLLRPLDIKPKLSNSFFAVMLGYFANLGLPRVGEIIRAATLAKYENEKVDRVMGTVIVDRVIDVILMLLVIIIAMFSATGLLMDFIHENNDISNKINSVLTSPILIGIVLIMLVIFVLLFKSKRIQNSGPGKKIRTFILGVIEGLKTIRSLKNPTVFVLHSLNIWLMYYLMLYVGFSAFEPTASLGPLAGLIVFTLGSFGIVIPSPGGMGTYHFLVTAGLMLYGVNGADGFSFANILFFTIQIFGNIIFGILAMVMLPFLNRGK
jgi:uncharacterized protein (TIRG00374 family)